MKLIIRDSVLDLDHRSVVMGILNVTPDSFSDGGRFSTPDAALRHAEKMVTDGADIIDIGGESTRPGAAEVSLNEELDRVIPVIEKLRHVCPLISIDTVKPAVADAAFAAGAAILNDISGMQFHPEIAPIVARHKGAAVLMHIQGVPRTMQASPHYDDVIGEIMNYLKTSISIAEKAGISPDSLAVDPGIGFGKRLNDNLTIIRELHSFLDLGKPILMGVSRKSFIGELTGAPVNDRLEGTLAAVTVSAMNGASLFRVHDVLACRRALDITDRLKQESP